jgi:hypothetical protein
MATAMEVKRHWDCQQMARIDQCRDLEIGTLRTSSIMSFERVPAKRRRDVNDMVSWEARR